MNDTRVFMYKMQIDNSNHQLILISILEKYYKIATDFKTQHKYQTFIWIYTKNLKKIQTGLNSLI